MAAGVRYGLFFAFIHWSLRSLSLGVFPHQRHNGQPSSDSEGRRARAASQPLGIVAACLYIKADLAEFAHTLGLPNTASISTTMLPLSLPKARVRAIRGLGRACDAMANKIL